MNNKNSNILFLSLTAAIMASLIGCTQTGRVNNRPISQNGYNQTSTNPFGGANGRHALVLLKSNGRPRTPVNNPNGGQLYGGSAGGQGSGGTLYGGSDAGSAGGTLYGGTQVNQQPGTVISPIVPNVDRNGRYVPQTSEGLHVLRLSNNGNNGISSYLYQGIMTSRNVPMQLDAESEVAVTTDGSGFAVTQPNKRLVLVGQWDQSGALIPINSIPFPSPTIIKSARTTEGEVMVVVNKDGTVGFIGVGVTNTGRLSFLKLREAFRPAGAMDTITDAAFSPGGKYVYFSTATYTSGFGQLVVCEMSTVMRRPQDTQRAAAESYAFGSGCFPGDPGMGYNQQQYNQQLLPANPTYVGTQVLSFVPKQLIVNWSMVGALSKLGPKILVNPNTGEHDNYLSGKLNIVGPTEVRNYVPYPLGTQASSSVLGYDYRFAVAHPRNSNLIVFGNKTSSTDSFMKVLSTENIVSLGKELDNYNLGPGLITTIGQDIGPLFDDYTPSLNGEFVLVGRPDLINIVSYVEDFKSVTYNGNQYDIPLYGFDPISIAVRTPTKFRQNNIDIKDLLADKEDADQNNPGS